MGTMPRIGLVVVAALWMAAPAGAAVTRYASPGGAGDCTTEQKACSLTTALTGLGADDRVVALAGTYTMGGTGVAVPAGVTLEGAAGPRPVITGTAGSVVSVAAGALLRHVRVDATDDFGNTAVSATGSTVEDVVATAGGPTRVSPTGVFLGDGALLRNTAVFVTGESAHAVSSSAAAPATADLRNVTAYSSGNHAFGVSVSSGMKLMLRSVIAHADFYDLYASGAGSEITVDHSAYSSTLLEAGGKITPGDGNTTKAPLIKDPASADAHELAGSPTIDTGVVDAKSATTDIDGEARLQGAAPDMGADEAVASTGGGGAPLGDGGGSGGGGSGSDGTSTGGGATTSSDGSTSLPPATAAPRDVTAPRLASLRFASSTFRRGSRLSFMLSEQATVVFTVERALPGRRVRKRCVPPTGPNRRARACTRYRRLRGAIRQTGKAGATTAGFTGRLSGRKLPPGTYRLTAVATDAAGNTSRPATARFRIAR